MPSPQKSNNPLQKLVANAEQFAKKATALSDMLADVERYLQDLPGKVEVVEISDSDDEQISFERWGDEWRLLYHRRGMQDSVPVTESNVSVKAAAAQLIPALVQSIIAEAEERARAVDLALKALERVSFIWSSKEDA